MITRSDQGAARDLNLDLWNVHPAGVGGLLDAVSVDSFLAYAFSVLLHREPDPSGSAHYRQRIMAGHSRQSVVRDLLASGEFGERYGAQQRRQQPLEDFINQIYQDVLGRWPDEAGMQTYVRIGSKWRGREKVERNILNSAEALQSGGGRLARVRGLQAYARQARTLRIPFIGERLRRHNEIVARLARIEHRLATQPAASSLQQLLAAQVHVPAAPAPVHPVMSPQSASSDAAPVAAAEPAPAPAAVLREARIDTLDAATATKLEKDGWVFRVAVRDARRTASTAGN